MQPILTQQYFSLLKKDASIKFRSLQKEVEDGVPEAEDDVEVEGDPVG